MMLCVEFGKLIEYLGGASRILRQPGGHRCCRRSPALFLPSLPLSAAALGVQQPSLLGASPTIYTQQTALAAAGLTTQSPANYQLSQSAALQQQAAAAAAALQQVKHTPRPALPELRKAKGSRRKGEWKMVNIAV